ncbi:collagen-like triple helix repeat-containing protein [Chitinophaga filiformis]|uniref:Collagen triple helix repeat-containing protein n=1 Tax=Chitinophaga filiformis TaxID=104663 RepID=A0A1G7WL00_CHIFI|nr:collagen-like protein [Chitinophaga filiformis]SDG72695.1 hypothetical protein SAMN04488121_10648 [Chitinophaga filiformis]
MRKMSLYALLLCGICLFGACGKDGAAGPKGDTGATGPAGPAGPKGADGEDATSGIIYSDWLDVEYEAVTEDTDTDGNGKLDTIFFGAHIEAEKLTDEILSTGDIKVFINTYSEAEKDIAPLPYTNPFSGASINASYSLKLITLIANGPFNTVTDNGVKYQQYRYVLIPGGTEARKAAGIDWNDYKQVKAYLHLKD